MPGSPHPDRERFLPSIPQKPPLPQAESSQDFTFGMNFTLSPRALILPVWNGNFGRHPWKGQEMLEQKKSRFLLLEQGIPKGDKGDVENSGRGRKFGGLILKGAKNHPGGVGDIPGIILIL